MNDFDALVNFKDYGHLSWLWSNSPLHREWSINLQARFLIPPIYLKYYTIIFDHNNMPVAYCSWAMMNQNSESKYLENPSYLEPTAWNSGNRLWIIDFVSPFSPKFTKILYNRLINLFPTQHAYAIRVKENSTTARILSFTGAKMDRIERKKIKTFMFNDFKKNYLESGSFDGRYRSVKI